MNAPSKLNGTTAAEYTKAMGWRRIRAAILIVMCMLAELRAQPATAPSVPGVVIAHIPAHTRTYIGSPGIAILPDGTYLAKHDEFGPGSTQRTSGVTRVYRSRDRGRTWEHIARLDDLFWSSIFVHRDAVYQIGTTAEYGHAVILRSDDGGETWKRSILFDDGAYHTAPGPVIEHDGRLWRAMEDAQAPGGWGERFRAFMMSAPVDADLLDPQAWTSSKRVARDPTWLNGTFRGWLEGNAVATPDGEIVNILRVDHPGDDEKAAIVHISDDGETAFEPANDLIDFPGGAKKFTLRFDPKSKLYWSLSNYVPPEDRNGKPSMTRNTLALIASPDLRSWDVRAILLQHDDVDHHAFQYVDWLFDGDDIIAVSRTAFDDEHGGAHRQHDANHLTFHRFENFRDLRMARAGEVIFKNGDRVSGLITRANGKVIIEKSVFGTVTAGEDDVESVALESPAPTTVAATTTAPAESEAIAAKPLKPKRWSGSVTASALATRGNSDTESFRIGAEAVRKSDNNTLSLSAGYSFGQQKDPDSGEESTTTDMWFAQGRLDHSLTDRLYEYALVRFERDNVAHLDLRASPGVGLGYRWIKNDKTNLNTEGGVTWVYENYDNAGSAEHVAVRLAEHFDHKINDKVSFVQNLEYLPDVTDPRNFNLNADAGIRATLTATMFTEFKVELRHDSTPAPDAEHNDLRYILGFGWKF